MNRPQFEAQFTLTREHYLANLDLVTWLRHYHVLRDLLASDAGDVLEIGTGDGIVRRSAEPMVASYRVLDINPNLEPDYLGDLRQPDERLIGSFDSVIATEVMEHLPFADMPASLANIWAWMRPGGRAFVSVPHRKSSVAIVTPKQTLRTVRFPNGMISLSELYNRLVRRQIWIDPNHVWEIGDGKVRQADVERCFKETGFVLQRKRQLPYSDYWILGKSSSLPSR
jgi:SAM-dependent methyltransferase